MSEDLKGLPRVMMAMAHNSPGEEIFAAEPREKRAVARLAALGLVTVRKTTEKFAGYPVIYFKLAPVGGSKHRSKGRHR